MASNKKHIITISIVAAIVLVLGITATFVIIEARSSRSNELPQFGEAPTYKLTERSGVSFSSDELEGKISVVDFFFTSCQGPCPVMSSNMSDLYKAFASTDKVKFVSISVDPTRDRLQTLQEYARRQGATDNRWVFLRGDMETIKWISEAGFKFAADELPAMHSIKFVLIDDKGQIRGYYTGTDKASVNVLKSHIRELVQNMS